MPYWPKRVEVLAIVAVKVPSCVLTLLRTVLVQLTRPATQYSWGFTSYVGALR
ncbi:hypothetical protein BDV98DRAFT_558420 [Pterulicium gracile]|uniref:Uncharacterized protein n=1 Tax=Pterulicium gracile TaxID=1884261 RepID=A0A5C3R273_9AGAR|nr:hypothetical protein BDV98DRAFT_558420 [Pterula gracilis]